MTSIVVTDQVSKVNAMVVPGLVARLSRNKVVTVEMARMESKKSTRVGLLESRGFSADVFLRK